MPARWSAIAFVTAGLLLANSPGEQILLALTIVSLGGLYNLAIQIMLPRRPGPFANGYLTTIGDSLLSVALVRVMGGGFDSSLAQIFFLITVAAALRVGYGPSLLVATVFSLAQLEQRLADLRPIDGPFIFGPGFLCLTALVASFVRRQARDAETELLEDRLRQSGELNAALEQQALHDVLTELPNRTLLHRRLEQTITVGQRQSTSFALLLMDLDRFKDVNDTFGHHVGDLLLQQIGPRVQTVVPASGTLARLGGDEFALLLPVADSAHAHSIAHRLVEVLEEPFALNEYNVQVGASIGIALYPEHGGDADELLRHADVAMYAAKATRGGYSLYSPEQDDNTVARLGLVSELRRAMHKQELILHFQPKVNMRTGEVVGAEALVRWQHPQRGLVYPDQFIALAEHTGLVTRLSQWVLDAALREFCIWRRAGLCVPVAVNLSMRDLHDSELPDKIERLLAEWNVEPAWLGVELTEGSLIAEPAKALETIARVRDLGVRVSIDDFGTGYSTLTYLRRLPADELKIDRSFVRDMVDDENDAAIVRSTIALGHDLGLLVVAEGVEDRPTWDLLAALGCDVTQGYYVGRPMATHAFLDWLQQRWRGSRASFESAA